MTANTTSPDREFVKDVVLDSAVYSTESWHVSDNLGGVVTTYYASFGDYLGYGNTEEEAESLLVDKIYKTCCKRS